LNGYGDNGQRKCGFLSVPRTIPIQLRAYRVDIDCGIRYSISSVFVAPTVEAAALSESVPYSAWNSKDSYDVVCGFFVVQFNGFMSLS
jgi:hypothetical protein